MFNALVKACKLMVNNYYSFVLDWLGHFGLSHRGKYLVRFFHFLSFFQVNMRMLARVY